MGVGSSVGKMVMPKMHQLAPDVTANVIHQALRRAIHGVGKFPPAAKAADKQLAEQHGNVDKAIHEVIENHVRYAGGQGFLTNIGGLVTAAVTIPANLAGLALIQCRMVAGIAHLRGYDLNDPRVHGAILMCVLGEDTVKSLVKKRQLPAPPMAVATAPMHDPDLDRQIANEVLGELLTKVAGKRLATTVGRRVPVVGGLVGAGADGYSTWQIGRYADRELLARAPRQSPK